MSVSAIIVTRGDVSLKPMMESLPNEWEKLVWCNGSGLFLWEEIQEQDYQPFVRDHIDYSVYGRYRAIEYASNDLIYVQDDDVIVSDPHALVHAYLIAVDRSKHEPETVICNMPQEFRHNFYEDHALVGFGGVFHRDSPRKAFDRYLQHWGGRDDVPLEGGTFFDRTCDIVFTGLSPRLFVDIPKENLPYAEEDNRMWKQPEHQGDRARMRELMLQVREGM